MIVRARLLLCLAGLTVVFASPALAQRKAKDPKTHSGKRIVEEPEEVVYRDSSEYHRQNKKGSVVAELIGFAPMIGTGIAGGFYLNPDALVELSHHQAELDFSIIKLSTSLTEVRLKHWFGNSFYVNTGLGLRTVKGEATLEPLTGNDDVESSVTASSVGGSIAIGNRWQWEYFSIGCDWIGYFLPIIKSEAEVKNSANASQEDIDDAEDDANETALESSGMLLRFYLGVSF